MTYNQDAENAIDDAPMPAWIKTMRALVYALIIVSILAMCALIYGAFSIINQETDILDVTIPNGASLISVTQMADGREIVIFEQDEIFVELRGASGDPEIKAVLE